MKVESRMFLLTAVFCWAAAIAYGILTSRSSQGTEYAGLAGLILSGGLLGLIGSFFWFVSRRIDPRPEDLEDAEIAEGAGTLGFFSPGSYWPFWVASSAAVTALGVALVQVWLILFGVLMVLFSVSGFLFEYYRGGSHPLQ